MRSDKLPHFTELDPPPKNYLPAKLKASEDIKSETERFLAQGGTINQVGSDANRNPQFSIGNVIRPER